MSRFDSEYPVFVLCSIAKKIGAYLHKTSRESLHRVLAPSPGGMQFVQDLTLQLEILDKVVTVLNVCLYYEQNWSLCLRREIDYELDYCLRQAKEILWALREYRKRITIDPRKDILNTYLDVVRFPKDLEKKVDAQYVSDMHWLVRDRCRLMKKRLGIEMSGTAFNDLVKLAETDGDD